ncbi:MAG: NAD(P)H-hydrate dehydratase [Kiritimatiellia bacterium]
MVGPGITAAPGLAPLLEDLLRQTATPLILDADAMNLMARHPVILGAYTDRPADERPPLVITPHPGEMARFLQTTADQIQADRPAAARRAVDLTGGIVILKGAGTLVAAPQTPIMVNLTGNPGMATGGSGDVLAGLLAGIIADGNPPFLAAQAAVYWHGLAGDHAARRKTERAMNAGDIIQYLPRALADLTAV